MNQSKVVFLFVVLYILHIALILHTSQLNILAANTERNLSRDISCLISITARSRLFWPLGMVYV